MRRRFGLAIMVQFGSSWNPDRPAWMPTASMSGRVLTAGRGPSDGVSSQDTGGRVVSPHSRQNDPLKGSVAGSFRSTAVNILRSTARSGGQLVETVIILRRKPQSEGHAINTVDIPGSVRRTPRPRPRSGRAAVDQQATQPPRPDRLATACVRRRSPQLPAPARAQHQAAPSLRPRPYRRR